MPDRELDFDDVPELTAAEIHRARRVGRPATGHAKQLIAIRLEPDLLAQIRKMATRFHKPYQTLIHEILKKAAQKAT